MTPRISVLMAVYNAAPYVRESLASVLNQDAGPLECVVVDDGSSDGSGGIVSEMARLDPRIRLLRQENKGLPAALNAGLAVAQGRYVARMDADDVSLPGRLARQAAFLDAHGDVAVVGCWVRTFGQARGNVWSFPTEPRDVAAALPFVNPVAHPAAMFRREAVAEAGGYDEAVRYGEDYELWARLSERHSLANLPEVLLRYRVHGGQMGSTRSSETQRQWYTRTQAMLLRRMGVEVDEASLGLHHLISTAHLASSRFEVSERLLDEAGDWLITLGKRNAASGVFDVDAFAARLSLHWRMLCGACAGLGGKTWRRYANSPLRPAVRPAKAELLLRLACLFHIGQERRNQAYGALRAALALKGRVLGNRH